MVLTNKDCIQLINNTFNQIGKICSTPKIMSFMTDGKTYVKEEHPGTFSSMNFVLKIIKDLPFKCYHLMNKQQAIRFVRVVKQRILRVLDIHIDFITINLSKEERNIFNKRENEKFIEQLTKRIQELTNKYKFTDSDLYIDNPALLKKNMALMNPDGSLPQNSPSPDYKPITNLQYKEVYRSDIVKSSITNFRIAMDDLDTEDKSKYKEDDTHDILWTIGDIKNEYYTLFTQHIYALSEDKYDTEITKLIKEHLKNYRERLIGIRKSANIKFTKKRYGVKDKKRHTNKKIEMPKEHPLPVTQHNNGSPSHSNTAV
jgi:hypothetical protein